MATLSVLHFSGYATKHACSSLSIDMIVRVGAVVEEESNLTFIVGISVAGGLVLLVVIIVVVADVVCVLRKRRR